MRDLRWRYINCVPLFLETLKWLRAYFRIKSKALTGAEKALYNLVSHSSLSQLLPLSLPRSTAIESTSLLFSQNSIYTPISLAPWHLLSLLPQIFFPRLSVRLAPFTSFRSCSYTTTSSKKPFLATQNVQWYCPSPLLIPSLCVSPLPDRKLHLLGAGGLSHQNVAPQEQEPYLICCCSLVPRQVPDCHTVGRCSGTPAEMLNEWEQWRLSADKTWCSWKGRKRKGGGRQGPVTQFCQKLGTKYAEWHGI